MQKPSLIFTSILFSFFIVSYSSGKTVCTIKKLEVQIESSLPIETKDCYVTNQTNFLISKIEIPEECRMIHDVSTTEVKVVYELDNKKDVVVELNNMNVEKPLLWQSHVKINGEPKVVVGMASEQIKVQCTDSSIIIP